MGYNWAWWFIYFSFLHSNMNKPKVDIIENMIYMQDITLAHAIWPALKNIIIVKKHGKAPQSSNNVSFFKELPMLLELASI